MAQVLRAILKGLTMLVLSGAAVSGQTKEGQQDRPTTDEIREAHEVADRFSKRLSETRDLQPLIAEFFVIDLNQSSLKDSFWRRSVNVNAPPENAHLTDEQLLRWYALQFSVDYAASMYLAGKMPLADVLKYQDAKATKLDESLFPEELIAYSKSLKVPKRTEPVDELVRFVFSTKEQTLRIWKDELTKHPPERTQEFQKNLARFLNHADDPANPWGQVKVSVIDKGGAGRSAGTRFIRLEIPFHIGLILVRDRGALKVWFAASIIPPD